MLFADVKGSMELAEQLDPEEWHQILRSLLRRSSPTACIASRARSNQYTGDGIMALFGAPIAHEDHAQRACYAALQLRDEIARYATEVQARARRRLLDPHGPQLGRGRRRQDRRRSAHGLHRAGPHRRPGAAHGEPRRAEHLLPDARRRRALVAGYFALDDLGAFQVKGVERAGAASSSSPASARSRTRFDVARARGLSRFVGRDADMQALEAALGAGAGRQRPGRRHRRRGGHGQEPPVLRVPRALPGARADRQRGRARVAHGKNIPFLPMLEVVPQLLRHHRRRSPTDVVREKIAGRLLLIDESFRELLPVVFEFFGVPDPERPPPRMDPEAQAAPALRGPAQGRARAAASSSQPVTLIEDLHWIDAGSEAFLEQWVDAIAGSRGLLLLNFRPEYHAALDAASRTTGRSRWRRWARGGARAARRSARSRCEPRRAWPTTIHERTGGNPFFTEEVVQSLIESGALAGHARQLPAGDADRAARSAAHGAGAACCPHRSTRRSARSRSCRRRR